MAITHEKRHKRKGQVRSGQAGQKLPKVYTTVRAADKLDRGRCSGLWRRDPRWHEEPWKTGGKRSQIAWTRGSARRCEMQIPLQTRRKRRAWAPVYGRPRMVRLRGVAAGESARVPRTKEASARPATGQQTGEFPCIAEQYIVHSRGA
jgi:hypothetical protein